MPRNVYFEMFETTQNKYTIQCVILRDQQPQYSTSAPKCPVPNAQLFIGHRIKSNIFINKWISFKQRIPQPIHNSQWSWMCLFCSRLLIVNFSIVHGHTTLGDRLFYYILLLLSSIHFVSQVTNYELKTKKKKNNDDDEKYHHFPGVTNHKRRKAKKWIGIRMRLDNTSMVVLQRIFSILK